MPTFTMRGDAKASAFRSLPPTPRVSGAKYHTEPSRAEWDNLPPARNAAPSPKHVVDVHPLERLIGAWWEPGGTANHGPQLCYYEPLEMMSPVVGSSAGEPNSDLTGVASSRR